MAEIGGATQSHVHKKGQFYGCYLLCSLNPKYKGRTYIGFTVNPNRRINQHNSGYQKGGAKRTSGRGPWQMVLIVHGFPNEISALRFEWAWQNPEKSLRLKHLVPRQPQHTFAAKFGVLSEMLRVGPWSRLPLTVRWLKQEYRREFLVNKQPPNHMPIEYGPVELINSKTIKSARFNKKNDLILNDSQLVLFKPSDQCEICKMAILDQSNEVSSRNLLGLRCLNCACNFHSVCLANMFLANETHSLIPIEGNCPKCDVYLMWGDLIRYRQSLFKLDEAADDHDQTSSDEEDEHDLSESDSQRSDQDQNQDYF